MKLRVLRLRSVSKNFAIGLLSCLLLSPIVYADTPSIDDLLGEAKTKEATGDHVGAVNAYSQVLEIDANHREARVGLAAVLVHAQEEAHHSDESDALQAVLERKRAQPVIETQVAESPQEQNPLVE